MLIWVKTRAARAYKQREETSTVQLGYVIYSALLEYPFIFITEILFSSLQRPKFVNYYVLYTVHILMKILRGKMQKYRLYKETLYYLKINFEWFFNLQLEVLLRNKIVELSNWIVSVVAQLGQTGRL